MPEVQVLPGRLRACCLREQVAWCPGSIHWMGLKVSNVLLPCRFVGGRGLIPVSLQRGYPLLELHYMEYTGHASVSLAWDAGRGQVGHAAGLCLPASVCTSSACASYQPRVTLPAA